MKNDPICETPDYSNGVVVYCSEYPLGLKLELCSENINLFSAAQVFPGLGKEVKSLDDEDEGIDSVFWCTPLAEFLRAYEDALVERVK